MPTHLEMILSKTLESSVFEDILSENRLKMKQYKKIPEDIRHLFSQVFDDQFISDLLLLSIFYRRVIFPMQETIKFHHLINENFVSETTNYQRNQHIIQREIVIGLGKKVSKDDQKNSTVNIEELQKIVDDFNSFLSRFNLSPNVFMYDSVERFLKSFYFSKVAINE